MKALKTTSFVSCKTKHEIVKIWTDWLKTTCNSTVSSMINEFERTKKAYVSKKTSMHKTGSLNLSRLAYYKTSDDIFKKSQMIPKGKNHAVYLLVDWSGSMRNVIAAVLQQIVITSIFCKKTNIPFEVVLFTTKSSNGKGYYGDAYISSTNTNLLSICDSSTNIDKLLSIIADISIACLPTNVFSKHRNTELINTFSLGFTPLSSSLALTLPAVYKWKNTNNIEYVNLICISDGEDTEYIKHKYQTVTNIVNPFNNKVYDTYDAALRYKTYKSNVVSCVVQMYKDLGILTTNLFIANKYSDNYNMVSKDYKDDGMKRNKSDFAKNGVCSIKNHFLGFDETLVIDKSCFLGNELSSIDKDTPLTTTKQMTTELVNAHASKKRMNIIGRKVAATITRHYE